MSHYLRKYEIMNQLNISKSTLRHWLDYFHEFIPQSKQGDITVYPPFTIQVLSRVKTLREELYSRSTILNMLAEEGYEKFK